VKSVGVTSECIAIGYRDGTCAIIRPNEHVTLFDAHTDIIDITMASDLAATTIALATPSAAIVFDCNLDESRCRNPLQVGTRLDGHEGRVTGVALNPYSFASREIGSAQPFLISADERGNVHRWRRGIGNSPRETTRVHRKAVHHLGIYTMPERGRAFITASDDRDIVVHALDEDRVDHRLNAHVGWIEQVLSVEDESILQFLVIADRVGVAVWDIQTKRVILRFRGRPRMEVVALSDPERVLVAAGIDDSVLIARPGCLRRVDLGRLSGGVRAVSLSTVARKVVLWVAIEDLVIARDVATERIMGQRRFPANILRMKAWKRASGVLVILEDGSNWILRC